MTVAFDHLLDLSDEIGTFEHADHSSPRIEHGYCVDDVARVLIAVCRADNQDDPRLAALAQSSLRFLISAVSPDGAVRNRRNHQGEWTSDYETGDCWGRAMWAFGVCSNDASAGAARQLGFEAFTLCARQTSISPRAMAFATLGAGEILRTDPDHAGARRIAEEYLDWFESQPTTAQWPWPEERLAYANAVICDALITAGQQLDRIDIIRQGLSLLTWLLDFQTIDQHLSVVPVGGAGPGDASPRFDQQPIEVARLADSSARAFEATYDPMWLGQIERCAAWFAGRNDLGIAMWDAVSGGGYDGLTARGPNMNQGAESTLAAITTMQVNEQFHAAPRLGAGER